MKIHPLMMDPEEKGDYHDGHLSTRWIVFIPNCPGPMVIQYVVWFLYFNSFILFSISVMFKCSCMHARARSHVFFVHTVVRNAHFPVSAHLGQFLRNKDQADETDPACQDQSYLFFDFPRPSPHPDTFQR